MSQFHEKAAVQAVAALKSDKVFQILTSIENEFSEADNVLYAPEPPNQSSPMTRKQIREFAYNRYCEITLPKYQLNFETILPGSSWR